MTAATIAPAFAATEPDEFLRRVRPAADTVPAGQVPATVTAAFIHLVELLNEETDGTAELDVVIRDRATGETAGIAPVSEDMAVAMLAGFSSATTQARIGEPEVEHSRPTLARPALSVLTGGVA